MTDIEPYVPREVEFRKIAEFEGWRLKVYGIATGTAPVSDELVEIGLDGILPNLPRPSMTEDRYGVGFAIIHRGTLRNWFSLDWWGYEDILFHNLYSSPLDHAGVITAEESAAIACVHELSIISFEGEAWIRTVLSNQGDTGFESYLDEKYETTKSAS